MEVEKEEEIEETEREGDIENPNDIPYKLISRVMLECSLFWEVSWLSKNPKISLENSLVLES